MRFAIKEQHMREGRQMVEVYNDHGALIAGIYPADRGLKIVSRTLGGGTFDETEFPPAIMIDLSRKP